MAKKITKAEKELNKNLKWLKKKKMLNKTGLEFAHNYNDYVKFKEENGKVR